MKSVLCFGDSNTYGYDGLNYGIRFPRDIRWPGVMQTVLGEKYLVIEEGLSGRTIFMDDNVTGRMSGMSYLEPCLDSHRPLNLVIIMLGTNDLKDRFLLTSGEIGRGMQRMIETAKNPKFGMHNEPAEVLIVAPVEGREVAPNPAWPFPSSVTSDYIARNQELAKALEWTAKFMGVHFASICDDERFPCNDLDGIHLTSEGHLAVAHYLAGQVKQILE